MVGIYVDIIRRVIAHTATLLRGIVDGWARNAVVSVREKLVRKAKWTDCVVIDETHLGG